MDSLKKQLCDGWNWRPDQRHRRSMISRSRHQRRLADILGTLGGNCIQINSIRCRVNGNEMTYECEHRNRDAVIGAERENGPSAVNMAALSWRRDSYL